MDDARESASCPAEADLLRLVDTPSSAPREHLEHLEHCRVCRSVVSLLRASNATESPASLPSERVIDDLLHSGLPWAERYELRELVGIGGMGIVFAAWDPRLQRKVAIKILDRSASLRRREASFDESRAMAKLRHPNLVAVFDAGESLGRAFIVMDLIDGTNLRRWLAAAPRKPGEIRAAVAQVARGLAAIHGAGLVHRDVKPENVLVDERGHAYVTDLGLSVPARTPAMPHGGTPGYMAPEQRRGDMVDAPTDVYALCVTALEMFEGQHCPRRLRALLLQGLAERPDDRCTLDELRHALEPQRSRWVLAGSVALSIAGTSAATWILDEPEVVPPCGPWESIRYDDAVQATLDRALDREASSYPPAYRAVLLERVGGFVQSWSGILDATCQRDDDPERRAALACLGQEAARFNVLSELAETTEAALWEPLEALPSGSSCLDSQAAELLHPMPADPALVGEVVEIRRELARAATYIDSDLWPEALAISEALRPRVDGWTWLPIVAEVESLHVMVTAEEHEFSQFPVELRRPALLAMEAHHDLLAAQLFTFSASIHAYLEHDDLAAPELEVATALVRGMPASLARERAEIELAAARAGLDRSRRDLRSAEEHARAGLHLARTSAAATLLAEPEFLTLLGEIAVARGDLEAAATHYEAALTLQLQRRDPHSTDVMAAKSNVAEVLYSMGRYREAVEHFAESLDVQLRVYGPLSQSYAEERFNLATVRADMGQYIAAQIDLDAVDAIDRHLELEGQYLDTRVSRGMIERELGRPERGLELFRDAEPDYRDQPIRYAEVRALQGIALLDLGRAAEALPLVEGSLAALHERYRGNDNDMVDLRLVWAEMQVALGHPGPAIAVAAPVFADQRERKAAAALVLAKACWASGNRARALQFAREGLDAVASIDARPYPRTRLERWLEAPA